MKILIYGYGYIGKNNYEFIKIFFDEVYIYDDILSQISYQNNFIKTLEDMKFDLILVSISEEKIFKGIKENLISNFSENTICFAPIFLSKPSELFLNFISDKFDKELIRNFNLHKIQAKLTELKKEYFKFKKDFDEKMICKREIIDEKYKNLDIFQKLYKTSSISTKTFSINYPGFSISYSQECDSRSFYFKDKIDFKALQNRDKKLILLLGNSFIRHDWLEAKREGISDFMRDELEEFIVINAGIHGCTLYEQLLIYNALFYKLKPEIVISFFGGTDHFHSLLGDDILLKNHSIIYNTSIDEINNKELFKSNLPLYIESIFSNNKLIKQTPNTKAICSAIYDRYDQFFSTVRANEGIFLGFLQPFLSKKLHLTSSEKELSKFDSIEHKVLKISNNFIDEFNSFDLQNYIDLNALIENEKKTCFYDHYLHCTSYANKKIAKLVSDRVRSVF